MKKKTIKTLSAILKIDKSIIKEISDAMEDLLTTPSVRNNITQIKKGISGCYYDNNETRNFSDVISGEYLSKEKRDELLK